MKQTKLLSLCVALTILCGSSFAKETLITKLSVRGSRFTINNKETFLFGISYYGGLGTPREFILRDLDDMQKLGINWLRVWATWAAFGHEIMAVNKEGKGREPYLSQLKWLVAECNDRGIIVDVTLSRGNRIVGTSLLHSAFEVHQRAVETIVKTLKPYRNWYLDMSNERNLKDERFANFTELKKLRETAKRLDPALLITASHAGDIPHDEMTEYLLKVKVDFISPHRPRNAKSPHQTQAKSRLYLKWMKEIGRIVPLNYQEPFRRGFTKGWEPKAADFATDAREALKGGAAGWCLHNGNNKRHKEGKPRRSFDMRGKRLFDALDEEEKTALKRLSQAFKK